MKSSEPSPSSVSSIRPHASGSRAARQNLAPETARAALRAGINGAITGDLLTTPGSSVEEERRLVLEAGYSL